MTPLRRPTSCPFRHTRSSQLTGALDNAKRLWAIGSEAYHRASMNPLSQKTLRNLAVCCMPT